jgi:hypothetical protein
MKRTLRNRSKRRFLTLPFCSHSLPSPTVAPRFRSHLPPAAVPASAAVVPVSAAVIPVSAASVPASTAPAPVPAAASAAAVKAVGLDLGGLDGLLSREGKSAA